MQKRRLLACLLALLPQVALADTFATKDIAIAWVEMMRDACAKVVQGGSEAAVDQCAIDWLAWAEEALPPSPYCQQHGAVPAAMVGCVDAIAHALTRYQCDGDLRFITSLTASGAACNEVALCGAPPDAQEPF